MRSSDYPAIGDAIADYLGSRGDVPMPRQGAIAIASPITGDRVVDDQSSLELLDRGAARRSCGFDRLEVINDFTALALALPLSGSG